MNTPSGIQNTPMFFLKKGKQFINNNYNHKPSDISREDLDILMELDIVKSAICMGYSVNDAINTLEKH